jgi:hypothetical protein
MFSGICVRAAFTVSVVIMTEAVGSSVTSVNIPQHSNFVESLSAIAKLRKATISSVMSVCLSVRPHDSAPTGRIFVNRI